jgi:hypothetical protein
MPHLDHKGPTGKGPKTGRKLGSCHKNGSEQQEVGELGKGQGLRHHSGGGTGKGKRNQSNKNQ